MTRTFIAYWWFVGWDCLSLGLHVCLSEPNLEIHLPFGFVRVGWRQARPIISGQTVVYQTRRGFGLGWSHL